MISDAGPCDWSTALRFVVRVSWNTQIVSGDRMGMLSLPPPSGHHSPGISRPDSEGGLSPHVMIVKDVLDAADSSPMGRSGPQSETGHTVQSRSPTGLPPSAVVVALDYFSAFVRLSNREQRQVNKAVKQYLRDPAHPSLQRHRVGNNIRQRLWTIRASRDLRILLAADGHSVVLLFVGHHDVVYDFAESKSFIIGQHPAHIGIVELLPEPGPSHHNAAPSPASEGPADAEPPVADAVVPSQTNEADAPEPADQGIADVPRPFDHWNHQQLRAIGLSHAQVVDLLALRQLEDLISLRWLSDEWLDTLLAVAESTPEQFQQPSLLDTQNSFDHAVTRIGGSGSWSQVMTPEEIERLFAQPVEQWMVFLHPDQRALSERQTQAPIFIRGAAGTGKTVVGLHRAAFLSTEAERFGIDVPVLFTAIQRGLIQRLGAVFPHVPKAHPEQVEFLHIHGVALRICRDHGDEVRVYPDKIGGAFTAAYRSAVKPGSPIDTLGLTRRYVEEEIDAVIKGRNLQRREEYLAVDRSGRRVPLGREAREQIWRVAQRWDEELANRKVFHYQDVINLALDYAMAEDTPRYYAAIVDEVQDVSQGALRLIHQIVRPPGAGGTTGRSAEDDRRLATSQQGHLFLLGDGGQRIYPGGSSFRSIGVEVRGRTHWLRVNYRNREGIINAAATVGGHDPLGEPEAEVESAVPSRATSDNALLDGTALGTTVPGSTEPGSTEPNHTAALHVTRTGGEVQLVALSTLDAQIEWIAAHILRREEDGAVTLPDVAVLVPSHAVYERVERRLRRSGIPFRSLSAPRLFDDDAAESSTTENEPGQDRWVRLGTYGSSKGLEFKLVFMPGLDASVLRPRPGESNAEFEERSVLFSNQLYVAMTRARDEVAILYSGELPQAMAQLMSWSAAA